MTKKWFQKAVKAKPPNSLGGWRKDLSPAYRRKLALMSRPKSWPLAKRRLSAGRALIALANVTRDRATKEAARIDAKYFFRR